MKPIALSSLALITGLIAVPTLQVGGAPILRESQKLPDEVRSLAGLHRINAVVDTVPDELRGLEDELQEIFHGRLEDADIVISKRPDVPRMTLQVQVSTSPDVPDGMAVAMVIALHQPAMVERLEAKLMLPTFSASYVTLTTTGKARIVVLRDVRFLTDALIRQMGMASARWKPQKEGP